MIKYKNIGNIRIGTDELNDDFSVDYLIDEYIVFAKNKKVFNEYEKQYEAFIKMPVLTTKIKVNKLGDDEEYGISREDFNGDKFDEIKKLIEIICIFKQQTEYLIEIIEKNFKTSHK